MSYPKHVNHELSPMACPVDLDSVDLFGEGYEKEQGQRGRAQPREAGAEHPRAAEHENLQEISFRRSRSSGRSSSGSLRRSSARADRGGRAGSRP